MHSKAEAVAQRCSVTKGVLRNFTKFTEKHLHQCLFFHKVASKFKGKCEACKFIEKETLAQMLSCEFYEISKNTFPYRKHLVAASAKAFNKSVNYVMFSLFSFSFTKQFEIFIQKGSSVLFC